ncbi:MAG TPA: LLM class flavin-dependent oxidoreductase [Acidimicrobiales bacterium]|nr:LLM class flavin-dependent oxidoreductase [Acidimicrobiales bacterium]
MQVDLLLETFGTTWPEVREAAVLAERAGFDGVWVNDHLAGSVQSSPHVLECWTILSALAAEVPRITVGPLVLNVANRDPGTLAVMAATLQHLSAGRLLVGVGAGARSGSPFAVEQEALGHSVPGDAERRQRVEDTITMVRRVWSGTVPPATGFLRPEPIPPIVVAALGPKMAELAGRLGDGICVPVGSRITELIALAREARARSRLDEGRLVVAALLSSWPENRQLAVPADVDRLIVYVAPPFDEAIARVDEIVGGWGPRT